ncbi:MAG: DUF4150 domain-containing protein [Myxococcales bacterium]
MGTVAVNAPKSPVTKGSQGVAAAAVPNVCKMPGPPAPFVPTPLPNIGKSMLSPDGYSTSVTIEGNAVAIKGSSFTSIGDIASKATGGGLISAATHGKTTFSGPGSMDVKIEGKNVQLLGDPTLNNSGSPANSASPATVQQPGTPAVTSDDPCEAIKTKFGIETGSHKANTSGKSKKTSRAYQSHHVLQDAAMKLLCPRDEACAIMLENSHKGTEHGRITARQNRRKHNKKSGSGAVPGVTFGQVKKQARDDLVKGLKGRRREGNKASGRAMTKKEAEQAADCIVAEAEAAAKKEASRKKPPVDLNDDTPVQQPGGCFAGGTLVRMASGNLREVTLLQPGDRLQTPSGDAALVRIDPCRHSVVELGVGESTLMVATYHRFYDEEGYPVRAGDLRVGDRVATAHGSIEITQRRLRDAPALIYRLGFSRDIQCLLGADAVLAEGRFAGPPVARHETVSLFTPGALTCP